MTLIGQTLEVVSFEMIKNNNFSMLALDLDGTLVSSRGLISEATKDAIREIAEKQIKVVICTGRRFRTAIKDVLPLGIDCPVIVHNGVLVKEINTAETLYSDFLSQEIYGEIRSFMDKIPQHPLIYVDLYNQGVDFFTDEVNLCHPFQIEYVMDNIQFCELRPEPGIDRLRDIVMVSLMANEDLLLKIARKAKERFSGRVTIQILKNIKYRGSILEFFSPQASKWNSLIQLAESYGISDKEIMAIGDDLNDLEMLGNCGLGIAMGNACDEVKEVAHFVTADNDNEGVLQAIRKFFI